MNMDFNNQRIKKAYKRYCKAKEITPGRAAKKQFARKLGVSYHTVEAWFRPPANSSYRKAPLMAARAAENLT